jgi:hypothetical protein
MDRHGQGEASQGAVRDLNHLTRSLFVDGHPKELKDLALYQHALQLLTVINDNRNERLDSADGSVPTVLWLVMLAGALITLGYPAFFGTSSLRAQILMTAALADLVPRGGARFPIHWAGAHFCRAVRSGPRGDEAAIAKPEGHNRASAPRRRGSAIV